MSRLRPVILSGGSGTRLWPLSTSEVPKQFVPLFGGRSLFELTVSRLAGVPEVASPIIVTGSGHRALVEAAMADHGGDDYVLVVEPTGRNTAPAALAAAFVGESDDVLVIVPSDHLVSDVESFRTAVTAASDHARRGSIVTFGIEPSRPETGYGYIEMGEPHDGTAFRVARFKEKPDLDEAQAMMSDGRHVWNSGMFVARADQFLSEGRAHCPAVVDGVRRAIPEVGAGTLALGRSFQDVEAISIDYAIMEKTTRALVMPISVGWDDVGSYQSLLAAVERDSRGNHVSGDVTLIDVEGSFVRAGSRKLAVVGMSDVVVVETEDAVLVLPLDRSQDVREIVKRIDQD